MSAKLYERCEHCDGTRKLVRDVSTSYQIGDGCPFCRTGYSEIGLTAEQLQSIIEERDRLLEFVARLAVSDAVNEYTNAGPEAKELVKGKAGRVEEYRHRKGIKAPQPPPVPPG